MGLHFSQRLYLNNDRRLRVESGHKLAGNFGMGNWTSGYTQAELDEAQEKFGLRFPADLIDLLRERRPIQGYDWRADDEAILAALRWPLEGMLFDVEHSDFWLPSWGERPAAVGERTEVVAKAVAQAPKLIPILAHRYIPEEPNERGNPVLSVYQTDIIYYGNDLGDYFRREFDFALNPSQAGPLNPTRRIPFWSDIIELGKSKSA
jgi:hypothetical protein